jgi:hypothetical protein
MDEHHRMLIAAAAICIHRLLVSYYIIFDDVPTASEACAAKKRKRELTPYKRNLSVEYGRPTSNLEHIPHLEPGAWFPLIGNNKRKLPYSDKVLLLAIHAAIRLHNFIMNSEQLSHSALESVGNL